MPFATPYGSDFCFYTATYLDVSQSTIADL